MKIYDVIIIGAGPAGCFSAYQLCKKRVNGKTPEILILEASPSLVRLKPCGGQINEVSLKMVPELKKALVSDAKYHLRYFNWKKLSESDKEIFYYFTRGANKKALEFYFPNMLSKRRNVTVLTGKRVVDIDNSDKEYAKVKCKDDVYCGKIVVDASGAMSLLNHKLAGGKMPSDLGRFICNVSEFDLKGDDKKILLDFLENDANTDRGDFFSGDPVGFYWAFYYRKIKAANIGSGFAYDEKRRKFDSKAELIKFINRIGLNHWKPESIHSWIAPYELQKKLYADHVLWIGDSAGMVNPFSGSGMPNACLVSPILAEVCRKALIEDDFSKESLKRYQDHAYMKRFISDFKKKNIILKISRRVGIMKSEKVIRFFVNIWEKLYG